MPHSISILGAGWLGLSLGAHLVQKGHTVHASTTNPDKLPSLEAAGMIPLLLDLASADYHPADAFWNSDVLIVTVPPSAFAKGARRSTAIPSSDYRDSIEKAIDSSMAEQVIYTSSTSVYGQLTGDIDEFISPQPHSTSAQMVLQVEELLLERMGAKATVLRLGGLVGGDREPTKYLAGRSGVKNGGAPVNLVHREVQPSLRQPRRLRSPATRRSEATVSLCSTCATVRWTV